MHSLLVLNYKLHPFLKHFIILIILIFKNHDLLIQYSLRIDIVVVVGQIFCIKIFVIIGFQRKFYNVFPVLTLFNVLLKSGLIE